MKNLVELGSPYTVVETGSLDSSGSLDWYLVNSTTWPTQRFYTSVLAYVVMTDSSQLTSDSQNLVSKMAERQSLVIVPPPPARFTLTEWELNNRRRYRLADDQQQLAERLLAESDRVREVTEEVTKLNKTEVDKKLRERITDIEFLKEENERQKTECCLEEEALNTYKERLLDAIGSLKENALKLCNKCIILRFGNARSSPDLPQICPSCAPVLPQFWAYLAQFWPDMIFTHGEGRIGIDMCHDDVEKELVKEVQTIEGAQSLLMRALEQTKEQTRLLRSTKYFLDRDHQNKGTALEIDRQCEALQETSLNLSMYHGNAPLNPGNVTNDEWNEFCRKNIDRAAKEINNARPLRAYINTLLKQVIDDLWRQYHITNDAFKLRIEDTRRAKDKLESEHYETVHKVNEMMRNITKLEKAIAEKEGFMSLAHTRLGNRAHRPEMELCRPFLSSFPTSLISCPCACAAVPSLQSHSNMHSCPEILRSRHGTCADVLALAQLFHFCKAITLFDRWKAAFCVLTTCEGKGRSQGSQSVGFLRVGSPLEVRVGARWRTGENRW
uniref:Tektin n=2 Tax=Timema TaxID=61471 RepID=A0A7R9PP50_TIMGE|nr:unnamed protein product [Timema genevievae]